MHLRNSETQFQCIEKSNILKGDLIHGLLNIRSLIPRILELDFASLSTFSITWLPIDSH